MLQFEYQNSFFPEVVPVCLYFSEEFLQFAEPLYEIISITSGFFSFACLLGSSCTLTLFGAVVAGTTIEA